MSSKLSAEDVRLIKHLMNNGHAYDVVCSKQVTDDGEFEFRVYGRNASPCPQVMGLFNLRDDYEAELFEDMLLAISQHRKEEYELTNR